MRRLFKSDHYSMLEDVYTHNFKIDRGTDQLSVATIQGAAFNKVNTVVKFFIATYNNYIDIRT